MKSNFIVLLFVFCSISSCMNNEPDRVVDMIVYNGKVYTCDDEFSVVNSLVVDNGVILELGETEDILSRFDSPNKINLKGRSVYPGFIDGHCHFFGYGESFVRNVDLRGTKSLNEVIEKLISHHNTINTEWIVGFGWDENEWIDKRFPTKIKLDNVFPNTPVVLSRIDGHAVLVNQKALNVMGITSKTNISGGEIILKNGSPSGILIDNAAVYARKFVPEPSLLEKIKSIKAVEALCFENGLTTVFDAGLNSKEIDLLKGLINADSIKIRISAMINPTKSNINKYLKNGPYYSDKLTINILKLFCDGALGSRGALLKEPYSDDDTTYGILLEKSDYYHRLCALALENNFQVATHCIGDSANKIILDIYGNYLQTTNDRRWRIEHAQMVAPSDIGKFRKYSVIPSIQSTHATSDYSWVESRIGPKRLMYAYIYKDLLSMNGWVVNGTDFPVEGLSPLRTFYAAITRKDDNGFPVEGFMKEQDFTRQEALLSITLWPAMGGFLDNTIGSLERNKKADFVILDGDIMTMNEDEILTVQTIYTFINGKEVFSNPDAM